MNKLLIIAHAPLASALRLCTLHVFPDLVNDVLALDVSANDSSEFAQTQASDLMHRLDPSGAGSVLVLTDLFGATPCNVAQKLILGPNQKLVAGVNLPMLLRAATYRHEPLDQMLSKALAGGMQGVMPVAISVPHNQMRRLDANQHHYDQQ